MIRRALFALCAFTSLVVASDEITASGERAFAPTDDHLVLEVGATATIRALDNDGPAAARILECSSARRGTVDCSDGRTIRYRPHRPFRGFDTFTYTARGPGWKTAMARVRVRYVAEPTARPFDDAFTVAAGERVVLDPVANDEIAEWAEPRVVLSPARAQSWGSQARGALRVDRSARGLVFRPAAGFRGRALVEYRLVDEARGFESEPAWITVEVADEAAASPEAVDDLLAVRAHESAEIDVLGNDLDPARVGLLLGHWNETTRAGGRVEAGPGGRLVYTPPTGFLGTDAFTYFAIDAEGRTSNRTTVLLAVEADDPPVAANDFALTDEDATVTIDVLANDSDPESLPLTIVSATSPLRGTATITVDDTIRFEPAPNHSGVDFFQYTAADPGGQTATARVTVSIAPVDDPPVVEDDTAVTDEEIGVSIPVLANDRDLEYAVLSLVSVGPAASGTPRIDPDQTIFYTPDPDFFGVDSFTYRVSDGGLESTGTVTVSVANRPDAPVANDDLATTLQDTSVEIAILENDLDPDRGTLVVTGLVQGQGGTADLLPDDSVRFTTAPGFVGPAFFEYRVANDSGLEDGALVSIDVRPESIPRAVDDAVFTNEDEEVVVDVLANDWDPTDDFLSLVSVGPAASGTPRIELDASLGPVVVYAPNPDVFGVDSFPYTITDPSGETATATVTVTIQPLPDFPVTVDDVVDTEIDTAVTIDALANDRDPDGGSLSVSGFSNPSGSLSLQPDGTFLYVPPPSFTGDDAFFYTARSDGGMEATARVTVRVLPRSVDPSSPGG